MSEEKKIVAKIIDKNESQEKLITDLFLSVGLVRELLPEDYITISSLFIIKRKRNG
jgi:hypothetical protein